MSASTPHERARLASLRGSGPPRRRSNVLRRSLAVVVVLALFAGAGYAGWRYLQREPAPAAGTRTACPPVSTKKPTGAAKKKAAPPVPAKKITVNVYNATERAGLAASVGNELAGRGFTVVAVANDPTKRTVTRAAEIRSGTKGAAAARTVAAQVDGAVVTVRDKRKDASVDLVLGPQWSRVRTPAAALAALTAGRATTRPPGC